MPWMGCFEVYLEYFIFSLFYFWQLFFFLSRYAKSISWQICWNTCKYTRKTLSSFKVHKFWEGHKILWNLHHTFYWHYIGQIYGGNFSKFCGLLRIYDLHLYDLLTEIRWYFDTGNVEIPLFLFLRMNTPLSNIWNRPLQNIKFQFDNGTKSVFLSIMWTETEAKEPAIISKKFHSGEQDWTIGLICENNFLKKTIFKGN